MKLWESTVGVSKTMVIVEVSNMKNQKFIGSRSARAKSNLTQPGTKKIWKERPHTHTLGGMWSRI